MENSLSNLKKDLSKNLLGPTIEKLLDLTKNEQLDFYNEVILHSNKFERLLNRRSQRTH